MKSALFVALFFLVPGLVCAAEGNAPLPLRIGVLTDMTGNMAELSGAGSVAAAELAVESVGARAGVSIVNADYQNRADVAERISDGWTSKEGVSVVVDVPSAFIAARLQNMLEERNRLLLTSSPGPNYARDFACETHSLAWLYDGNTLLHNLISALVASGKKRWFFLSNEEPYSIDMAKSARGWLKEVEGELVGEAQLNKRMSGLALVEDQAEKLHPDIIFLAFDRPDTFHLLGHWPEGPANDTAFASSSLLAGDAHPLSELTLPHYYIASSFYWDQDAGARTFADEFSKRSHGLKPSVIQASVYSSVRHYLLNAQNAAQPAKDIYARMVAMPMDDPLFKSSRIRADGLVMHKLHLMVSKNRDERQYPWDHFRIVRTLAPEELILPAQTACTPN